MERVCRNRTLAHGTTGCIQQCSDCGVISLHLGGITMRVDVATAEALWALLGEALHEVSVDVRTGAGRPVGRA